MSKIVSLDAAANVADDLSSNKEFRDSCNYLWRDNLNFNLMDADGYMTQECKDFIKSNEIKLRDNETWYDAVLRFAQVEQLGYQVPKAPRKRSDVKFSGSMILSQYIALAESGREGDYKDNNAVVVTNKIIADLHEAEILESYK